MEQDEQQRRAAQQRRAREARAAETQRGPSEAFDPEAVADDAVDAEGPHAAQWATAGVFGALGVGALLLQALYGAGLEQTAALFVALPTVLGIMLSLAGRPGSALGIALRGITLFLLMSAIVFREGVICILMGAPLYYGVAALVGWAVDQARKRQAPAYALLVVPLLPVSLEGTAWEVGRQEQVEVVRVVQAESAVVRQALAQPPDVSTPLPAYLRMGFPRPVHASGAGLAPGDVRAIDFAGGEGEPGQMLLEVTRSGEDHAVFELVHDGSHIAHWLSWDRATVSWRPVTGGTEVRWRIDYTRHLDPFWWFAPWQRYAVERAADYLVRAHAPR
ncbi:MAG: hypothetical protein KTR31_15300 [Myxococcales bacterium]|nr:hypothetical protein [Myxococcales bacterium]